MTADRNKIYIFVLDPSISTDFLENLKIYCLAYYTGMTVEIIFPKSKTFLEEMKITNRINDYTGQI